MGTRLAAVELFLWVVRGRQNDMEQGLADYRTILLDPGNRRYRVQARSSRIR